MANSERAVIITGGASGIGRAITEHLAAAGFVVGILDQNGDALIKTVNALKSKGIRCLGYSVDIRDYSAVRVAVYSATKGGIIALMKTLAREHTRHGITFNSICPGPTDTPFLAEFDQDSGGALVRSLEKAIPMRRLAQPSDFPALVAYFLSEESAYVTGQTISVSGGLTMHG